MPPISSGHCGPSRPSSARYLSGSGIDFRPYSAMRPLPHGHKFPAMHAADLARHVRTVGAISVGTVMTHSHHGYGATCGSGSPNRPDGSAVELVGAHWPPTRMSIATPRAIAPIPAPSRHRCKVTLKVIAVALWIGWFVIVRLPDGARRHLVPF